MWIRIKSSKMAYVRGKFEYTSHKNEELVNLGNVESCGISCLPDEPDLAIIWMCMVSGDKITVSNGDIKTCEKNLKKIENLILQSSDIVPIGIKGTRVKHKNKGKDGK